MDIKYDKTKHLRYIKPLLYTGFSPIMIYVWKSPLFVTGFLRNKLEIAYKC